MSYRDRPVTGDDAGFIVALHRAPHASAHVPAPTEEAVRARIDDPAFEQRMILDAAGTPVGVWSLALHDGWLAEFVRIVAVAPRRGIGSWAMHRMIACAFDGHGAHRAYLEVTADNTKARALYEREGFTLEGTFREGYRAQDGTFKDLCAYGLLARDRRSSP